MAGPLDGIKIIDCSAFIAGPLATMILGDQGADVIKVEPPGFGDVMRILGTSRGGMSGLFANCNRSKRSIVLDLKQADASKIRSTTSAGKSAGRLENKLLIVRRPPALALSSDRNSIIATGNDGSHYSIEVSASRVEWSPGATPMSREKQQPRKPASKFPHLRKKKEQAKPKAKPVKKGKP